jgi:rhodanese-related sulfurtransferase
MHAWLWVSLLLTGAVTTTGCRPSTPATGAVYQKISAQEAKTRLDKERGIILVDVRTEAEYRDKRIAGSLLIPHTEIEKQAPKLLPKKDAVIFVYCRSGRRSDIAAHALVALGYTRVYDFGGIIDWPFDTVSGK